MRIKKGFALREVCGEQVVMGEGLEVVDFRNLVGLNATASFLWKEAEQLGEFTSGQLVAALQTEYEVKTSVAEADVERTLDEWLRAGIIEQ